MIENYLINRFKKFKRQVTRSDRVNPSFQFAFVGAGNHSLQNLYPCLQYLGLSLKYICTQHISSARQMAIRFPGCTGTDNLSDILQDPAIKGVFVCLPPRQHYHTVAKLFSAGKHVFVEKPVCYSLEELKHLISAQNDTICVPGLQKRFCSINQGLQKKLAGASSYHYRYLCGAYPEGDPVVELFIHPVDNVVRLFGQADVAGISRINSPGSTTFFVLLRHAGGPSGCLELSTNYSWTNPVDHLEINAKKEILKINYPGYFAGIEKPGTILGMPLEKVQKQPEVQRIYFKQNGFSPLAENNSLVVQGFLGELAFFVRSVEKNERSEKTSLSGLLNTYEILDSLGKAL